MLCDICKKNEATIHIQEIGPEGKKTVNLCQNCAEKEQSAIPKLNLNNLNIGEVLLNIKKITDNLNKSDAQKTESANLFCPKCNWTMEKLERNNGMLGCAECYHYFAPIVEAAIENIHRSKIHTGKRPANHPESSLLLRQEKLRKLEAELNAAINSEEYEKAAVLRDEINALRKNAKKNPETAKK